MRRLLFLLSVLTLPSMASAALDAVPSRSTSLTGHWQMNVAQSDDAERLLAQRLEKEYAEERRWRERAQAMNPPGLDVPAAASPSEERRRRRIDRLKEMLGVTQQLDISQDERGTKVEIASDAGSRRFVAGTRSQVSMPEGELADSEVGWDGDWFVIDRRVKKGPRVVEKYRLVPKTGQLESIIAWSGETVLSGIKVRRIFDRVEGARPPPADPALGPSP